MDAAPSTALPPSAPGSPTWPRAAQLAAALLLGAAIALLAVHAWSYQRWASRPTDLDPARAPAYRVNLNRADRAELLQLPGVGPKLAARIEAYRRENGGFRGVDELRKVQGIGPAALARLRPWVCVEDAHDDADVDTATASVKHSAAPPAGGKKTAPTEPININKASAADLRRLPGIGPKLSQAIVDERDRAPFKSADDLCRVHGIGAKTLDKLRPYVTVSNESARVASSE
jgi:competence protein ComEA